MFGTVLPTLQTLLVLLFFLLASSQQGKLTLSHDRNEVILILGVRFGLWLADLSINQVCSRVFIVLSLLLFITFQVQQEQVEEEHRGVIGGVQSALQQLFDMTKFLLVIFMPNPHMFGILILLSFIFVTLGAIFMTAYAGLKGKLNCCGSYKATNTQEPDLSLPD